MMPFGDYNFRINTAKFIETKRRTSDILQFLGKTYNQIHEPKRCLKLLKKMMKNAKNPLKILKILTLLDVMLLTQRSLTFQELSAIINKYSQSTHHNSEFKKFLSNKIIQHYIPFLYKRCLFIQNILLQDHDHKSEDEQANLYLQCYRIINLLNCGLSFHQTIFTLGRYYSQQIWFLIDFNIILSLDFKQLYQQLTIKFTKVQANTQKYFELIKDIEEVHEKMNSIYCNVYHYKYLKPYKYNRIETDKIEISPTKTKTSSSKKKSIEQTAAKTKSPHTCSFDITQNYQLLTELQKIVVFEFDQGNLDEITQEMVVSTVLEDSQEGIEFKHYQDTSAQIYVKPFDLGQIQEEVATQF